MRPPQWDDFDSLVAGKSKQTYTWDFSTVIPLGQTLQGNPVVVLTVVGGTQPNPNDSNLAAGPAIGTAQLTATEQGTPNCAVLGQVGVFTPGQPGTVVRYRCDVSCPVTPNSLGVSDVAAGFNFFEVITPP